MKLHIEPLLPVFLLLMKEEFELVAKTFHGLEEVLAKELTELGASNIEIGNRMVAFTGDKALMYKANFCLRTAIRIGQGKITIDGQEIQLPQNNYGHCLHGGPTGWQYSVFKVNQPDNKTIKLTVESPDGDNNFPGNVMASVTYTLTDNNAIDIRINYYFPAILCA